MDNRFDRLERRMENGWIMGAAAGAALTVITTILAAMFAKDWL